MIRPLLVFLDLRNYLTAEHLADGLECLPSMAKALSNTQYWGRPRNRRAAAARSGGTILQSQHWRAEAGRLVVWGQPELNSVKRGGGAQWADTCHQTWQPEFLVHPQDPQDGRTELIPPNCPLISTAHPDTYTQSRQVNKNVKEVLAKASKPSWTKLMSHWSSNLTSLNLSFVKVHMICIYCDI